MTAIFDCAVIGAGPAGLTASLYLTRFRRSVIVADEGRSRASWIPRSHNFPGFPQGVNGKELLVRLKRQAEEFGCPEWAGGVQTLQRSEDGLWAVTLSDRQVRARTILLATGVVDRRPPLRDCDDAIKSALLRFCPICDGFEAMSERIAVIGNDDHAARETLFLRSYSANMALLSLGAHHISRDFCERLTASRVPIIAVRPDSLAIAGGKLVAIPLGGEGLEPFEVIYAALGVEPQNQLAQSIGAGADDSGCLAVDSHQQTRVPGVYAAGDVVRGLHQISVAIGEAAIAATAIHNSLPPVPAQA